MTTAVLAPSSTARRAANRPGLGHLTLVELRKMTDTRAGFWLLLSTAALTALVAVVSCLVFPDDESNLVNFLAVAVTPASVLMPVIGILLVTSEWSQRTAMITFTLVPERSRVLVAKLLAALALSAIAFQLCTIVALVATAVAGADGDATWSMSAGLLGQAAFTVAVSMLGGVAFGMVLLASAPAIVLYYLLPTAWGALGSIPALEGAARWLDQGRTMAPIVEETLSALQWARVATSLAVWLLLPLVLGFWRVARSDVR
jgi:ABC-2 type transport system permease protein